ncbi:MAG: MoaD/ThiS family protein [Thermoplasmata archaeon]
MTIVELISSPKKTVKIKGERLVSEILKELSLTAETHIVLKNGVPVPEDDKVSDSDTIQIIRVFSGG